MARILAIDIDTANTTIAKAKASAITSPRCSNGGAGSGNLKIMVSYTIMMLSHTIILLSHRIIMLSHTIIMLSPESYNNDAESYNNNAESYKNNYVT